MQPFFSIVIPTINSGAKLFTCIDSLRRQKFTEYEILIIDGVSSDGSLEVLFALNDPKIKIYSGQDKGVYDAMNNGMHRASGQWIYFLGADDELMDDYVLGDVYEFVTSQLAMVIYGNVLVEGHTSWARSGEIYAGKFSFKRLCMKNICHQAIFYNLEFLRENRLKYDLQYPVSADWDFNFRCWRIEPFTFIPRTVARFRAGGLSTLRSDNFQLAKKRYYPIWLRLWIMISFVKRRIIFLK